MNFFVRQTRQIQRYGNQAFSNHDDDGNKERHKFAYLTMKNNSFARFARAFFTFGNFADVLVLSTT